LTDKYLLPAWGTMKLRKMNIIELQDFFNAFYPRLSAKSIRLGLGNGGEERGNWGEAASEEAAQAYDPVAFGDNRQAD
jgi:hypothetical protein